MAIDVPERVFMPMDLEAQSVFIEENILPEENRPGWQAKVGATIAAVAIATTGFLLNNNNRRVETAHVQTPTAQIADGSLDVTQPELAGAAEAYAAEQQQVADYLAAVGAQEAADAQAKAAADAQAAQAQAEAEAAVVQQQTPPQPASSSTSPGGFFACVRAHESDTAGSYGAVSSDGQYLGAYQFSQSTWNNTAQHAGRSDLVGVPPNQASPADQDAMAESLYEWQGSSPWAGDGC